MIRIGSLEVDFEQRELYRDDATVRVGSRALDVLRVLIDADGALVTKDEIMHRVWQNTIVEENNLQVQVASLRRAFGNDRDLIRTIPGRGYQLVGPQRLVTVTHDYVRPNPKRRLPASASRLVGRASAVSDITALLGELPQLTLVGAGGIGKTSLAIAVAHSMSMQFRDGVHLLELAALSDDSSVLASVAEAFGISFASCTASGKWIAQALANLECLIVLDNAEHVVETIADLVSELVVQAPKLRVLVTSREPLRIASESLYRVQPLAVPARDAPLDELLARPAVQLFLCRARALDGDFGGDPRSLCLIGDICRRLDGIALAIELAAARAVALGVEGVYRLLDDRMQLLTGGHRQSLPRHQTLRATFDWSYALLDPIARLVFRRLGIFTTSFTLESACAVVVDQDIPLTDLISGIADLAAKSLLNVDCGAPVARYRLTESTRAYALDKLRDEGELHRIAERHARFLQRYFDGVCRTLNSAGDRREATRDHGARIWNLQASLAFAKILHSQGQWKDAIGILRTLTVHLDARCSVSDVTEMYALLSELEGCASMASKVVAIGT